MNTIDKIKKVFPNLELLPAQIKLIEETSQLRNISNLEISMINNPCITGSVLVYWFLMNKENK